MKSILSFFFTCIISSVAFGQNIVVNGDLEDVNICDERTARCSPAGWFYFKYDPQGFANPGFRYKTISASGNCHFILLAADTTADGRDYWQTKLLCALEPGKKYTVSLKISATWANPNLNDIGIWFTDQFVYATKDTVFRPDNAIGFIDAKVKAIKNGWFLITKEIVATNNASILVVGNFSKKSNPEILLQRNLEKKPVFIFVDDISINCEKNSPCIVNSNLKDSLYALKKRHSKYPPFTNPFPVRKDSIIVKEIPAKAPVNKVDTISISSIQFALDDYRITDKSVLRMLNPLRQKMNAIEKMEVIGFTDDLGSESYNLELSKNRAASVIKMLANDIGIDPKIIYVRGEGISRRFEKKELNRRVDIYIYWK